MKHIALFPLRLIKREAQLLSSPVLAILGIRRGVSSETFGFGYTKGSLTIPIVMVIVTVIEIVVVHFLVPWWWLELLLLVLALYAVWFIFGILSERIIHPHLLNAHTLQLRWGERLYSSRPSRILLHFGYTRITDLPISLSMK